MEPKNDRDLDIAIWKDENPDLGEPTDEDLAAMYEDPTIITEAGEVF